MYQISRIRTKGCDSHEVPIARHTLEDIVLVINPSAVYGVEDLTEYEDIEDRCIEFVMSLDIIGTEAIDDWSGKMESEDDDGLVNGLANYHLAHIEGEQRCSFRIRPTVQQAASCTVGGEGKGGERVHDNIDPEQLYRGQD